MRYVPGILSRSCWLRNITSSEFVPQSITCRSPGFSNRCELLLEIWPNVRERITSLGRFPENIKKYLGISKLPPREN